MEWNASTHKSTGALIRQLVQDAKTAISKELELAKAELLEQVTKYGRNAAWLTAGASVAYVGIIMLFISLGVFIGWLLTRAGVEQILAIFAGFGIMAVLTIGTGIVVLLMTLKKLRTLSLAPKKTVYEAKQLAAEITGKDPSLSLVTQAPKAKRESAEIQAELEVMHQNIEETVDDLRDHFTLNSLKREALHQVKTHPLPAALLGTGAVVIGFLMVRKARRRPPRRASAQNQSDGLLGKVISVIKASSVIVPPFLSLIKEKNIRTQKKPEDGRGLGW